jgi:hypothetical protein
MYDTSFYLAKIDLTIISQRMQNALDEIQRKSPNRIDYIEPMTKSIDQVNKLIIFLEEIHRELDTSKQRNVDLEFINLKLLKQIEELNNKIKYNNLEL